MKKFPIHYGDLYYENKLNDGKVMLFPCRELDNTQKYIFNFLRNIHIERVINENLEYDDLVLFEYKILDINKLFSVKFLKRLLNKIFVKAKFPTTIDKSGFYQIVTFEGKLPENTITTPLIINVIIDIFEEEILNFCQNNEIIYKRAKSQLYFYSKKDVSKMIKEFLKGILS